jgi:UDP-2-acetamido-2,6-beta-L-arabino-hexul-4-ose reductase
VAQLPALLQGVDFVFHLAGVNRPQDPQEFVSGNVDLTQALCKAVGAVTAATGKLVPIVYTSSAQAGRDNPYGQSKRGAEESLQTAARNHQVPVHIFRLPNVFGKWYKPNYNSAVATFCHNIARCLPIQVNDPAALVTLVYVDDVIARFLQLMDGAVASFDAQGFATLTPQHTTTVRGLRPSFQLHGQRDIPPRHHEPTPLQGLKGFNKLATLMMHFFSFFGVFRAVRRVL